MRSHVILSALLFLVFSAVASAAELRVTATAYNSLPEQTQGDPKIAAWGDRLEPGMAVIAVSRDLLALGLTRGRRVEVEGFDRPFVVLDKTAARFSRRIDIYMGLDRDAALEFGKRQVSIRWEAP